MTTYAEKLKDPLWLDFRREFIARRCEARNGNRMCDDCGEDTDRSQSLHVHHRRYIKGREPWEYDDDDLRLLCEDCHGQLHDLERRVRAFILAMPAHYSFEFNAFMDQLEACPHPKIGLARAKNAVAFGN